MGAIKLSCFLTDSQGWPTMKGYLAQWSLMTYLDVRRTCELLAYLGYHTAGTDNQLSAITVTKSQRSGATSKKQRNARTVFMGHVIGPPGVGKTAFCQGLLGRSVDVSPGISVCYRVLSIADPSCCCTSEGDRHDQLVVRAAPLRGQATECLRPEQDTALARCGRSGSGFALTTASGLRRGLSRL